MVRKHLIGLFLNGGTSEKPDWVRVKKATQLTLAMNPETEDYDYIADEVPTTELKRYKPSIDEDLTMYKGEKDYEMIWPYFYEMRTGSDAHVECMVVFMQEPAEGGEVAKGTATKSGDAISFAEKTAETQAAESTAKSAKTA